MKKLIALLLILAMSAFAFVSCNPPETPEGPGQGEGGGDEDGPNIDPDGWTQS